MNFIIIRISASNELLALHPNEQNNEDDHHDSDENPKRPNFVSLLLPRDMHVHSEDACDEAQRKEDCGDRCEQITGVVETVGEVIQSLVGVGLECVGRSLQLEPYLLENALMEQDSIIEVTHQVSELEREQFGRYLLDLIELVLGGGYYQLLYQFLLGGECFIQMTQQRLAISQTLNVVHPRECQ